MNKSELIDAMAAGAGISKAAAKKALESLLGRAIDNVINSDPSGNNVLAFEYSVSIGSNRDTNA